jgi:two-component system, chemotaxis family, CheB/CheR fusion protein
MSGVVATFVDISGLTRSEEYVRELRADRLRSMAEMATGLAHELNQPLSAIATYLKAIRRLLQLLLEEQPASIDEALDHARIRSCGLAGSSAICANSSPMASPT